MIFIHSFTRGHYIGIYTEEGVILTAFPYWITECADIVHSVFDYTEPVTTSILAILYPYTYWSVYSKQACHMWAML